MHRLGKHAPPVTITTTSEGSYGYPGESVRNSAAMAEVWDGLEEQAQAAADATCASPCTCAIDDSKTKRTFKVVSKVKVTPGVYKWVYQTDIDGVADEEGEQSTSIPMVVIQWFVLVPETSTWTVTATVSVSGACQHPFLWHLIAPFYWDPEVYYPPK